jgi:hypothetical protein
LAEWLRSGLQSRLHRFDSGRRLASDFANHYVLDYLGFMVYKEIVNGRLKVSLTVLAMSLVLATLLPAVAAAKKFSFHSGAGTDKTTVLTDGPLPKWDFDFGMLECTEVSGEDIGEIQLETEEEDFNLTLGGCTIESAPVKIDWNGCFTEYKAGTFEGGNYEGSLAIRCSAGKVIEFTATDCTIRVTPQIGLKKVTLITIGFNQNQEVTADMDVSGLNYEEKGVSCASPGKAKSNGTLVGSYRITAEDKAGNMTAHWVA